MTNSAYDMIANYWLAFSGIVSFIFVCGYHYSSFKQIERNRQSDNKMHEQKIDNNYKDCETQIRELKKDHDEKITVLFSSTASNTAKIDSVKDETMKAIQGIQLDVREIMTILKSSKKE